MRINVPTNPTEFIALSKSVLAKHTALGAASPLNSIPGIAGFNGQVTAADTNNTQAALLTQQAEAAIEARDNALGDKTDTSGSVRFFVTAARDLLLAMNKNTEHKLGDWGFQVIASSGSAPATPPAPPHP